MKSLTHQTIRPTPVHYPPALVPIEHSSNSVLGRVISATHHQTCFDHHFETPRFSTEHLQNLNHEGSDLLTITPQGFREVKKDHHQQAYDSYVAYCNSIGVVVPLQVIDGENIYEKAWFYKYAVVPRFEGEKGWIGNPFIPTTKKIDRLGVPEHILQGAETPQKELADKEPDVECQSLERCSVRTAPAHWFPTMCKPDVGTKRTLGFAHDGGMGKVAPLRVRSMREVQTQPTPSTFAQFYGDLAKVIARRNRSSQEPACWTRKAATPITFDKHLERVAYRPSLPEQFEQVTEKSRKGVDGTPDKHSWPFLYNKPLQTKNYQYQWGKPYAQVVTDFYYKMARLAPYACTYRSVCQCKSGYAHCLTARQVEQVVAREREQDRVNRLREYLCELADGSTDGVKRVTDGRQSEVPTNDN